MLPRPRHPDQSVHGGLLDRCVLEIAGHAAGILVRDGPAYTFFSASRRFNVLDRERFKTIGKACRRLNALADRNAPDR